MRVYTVQAFLFAGRIPIDQMQPISAEGDVAKYRKFVEKSSIFPEHPVRTYMYMVFFGVYARSDQIGILVDREDL